MEKENIPDIETQISDILKLKVKKYLTVNQIRNELPIKSLKYFKLTKKSSPSQVIKALTPCFGNTLTLYKGPRSMYIGFNMPLENIIMDKIRQKSGISSKALGANLPMIKKEYLPVLNNLIGSGAIICSITEDHGIRLEASDKKEEILKSHETGKTDFRAEFKAAYDDIGKGRGFVRIHRIRERLGWPEEQFNRVLKELMADYAIELHSGDPSTLTEKQINDSFTDKNGILSITLTWWGAKQ